MTCFSQTVLQYGWIPFIIYVGYTRSNPQPSLIKCVGTSPGLCSAVLTQKQTPQPLSIENLHGICPTYSHLALHACTRIFDFKSYNLTALLPTLPLTVRTAGGHGALYCK